MVNSRGGPFHVLVADDATERRRQITQSLREEGFEVQTAEDGERAVELARSFQPDVIVLDRTLPKMGGVEVCRQVRTFSDAYVVMLTARDDEMQRLVAFSTGADEYLTKSVSLRELIVRIRALLRRPRHGSGLSRKRRLGDLVIDPISRQVYLGDSTVELTPLEFDLLNVLSAEPGVVFSRKRLADGVWGPNWHGDLHVVDVHISKLRRKLRDDPKEPRFIRTVRGVGFRVALRT